MVRATPATLVAPHRQPAAPAAGGHCDRPRLPEVGAAGRSSGCCCIVWPLCWAEQAGAGMQARQPRCLLLLLPVFCPFCSWRQCRVRMSVCTCRQELMPEDKVFECLDKVVSHCKDVTKTGCFGGWSGKTPEVGAGACPRAV